MTGTFTKKKAAFPYLLLLGLLSMGGAGFSQTLGCYTGGGPALDVATAKTEICPGQKAALTLKPFPADETAVWYGSSDRTTPLAVLTNTDPPYSPNPGASRVYWVALRQSNGCESDLLEVAVKRLDNTTCPVKNLNQGRSYRRLQEAHDDAAPGDEFLLPPGQYQAAVVSKGLKFTGETPAGQTQKAQITIQGLEMNGNADLELNNGVFIVDGSIRMTKGHVRMNPNSSIVLNGQIEGGDDQSAIKAPLVGQDVAANFGAQEQNIAPGAIRIKAVNTPGQKFIPLIARNKDGGDEYFPLLLELQTGNTAKVFDLALAGPAGAAQNQTYPGLTPEEETGIRELAKAANQRPGKVDQIFLLGPADGNSGKLNLTVSAQAAPGGPIHPILWNWEPRGIDPTIMTIDNDVALFRGVKKVLTGFNTYSTVEPVSNFSPFIIVEGPLLQGPAHTSIASVERAFQTLPGTLTTGPAIASPGSPCFDPATQSAGLRYYQVIPFTVSQQDIYTFQLDRTAFTGPAIGAVYKGAFDESNLCRSLLFIGTENLLMDGAYYRDGKPLFRLPLQNGEQYYLLTVSKEAAQTGDYAWRIFSDGSGELNAGGITNGAETFSGPILHVDLGSASLSAAGVYQIDTNGDLVSASSPELERALQATGYARFTGCASAAIQVTDVLNAPDPCGDDTIERTFTVISQSGCSVPTPDTYTQLITVRKPTVAENDFIAPSRYTFVDRDLFRPDFSHLDQNGYPDPFITGAPMLSTPFAFYGLNGSSHPLSQQYGDTRFTPPAGAQGQFQRDWSQSNSCLPGETFAFSQSIREIGYPIYNSTLNRYYDNLTDALEAADPGDVIMLEEGGDYTGESLLIRKSLVLVIPPQPDGSPGIARFGSFAVHIPGGGEATLAEGVFDFFNGLTLTEGHLGIGLEENKFAAVATWTGKDHPPVAGSPRAAVKFNLPAGRLPGYDLPLGEPAGQFHVISGTMSVNGINVDGLRGVFLPAIFPMGGSEIYIPIELTPRPGNIADGFNIGSLGDIAAAPDGAWPGLRAKSEEAIDLARREMNRSRPFLNQMFWIEPNDVEPAGGALNIRFSLNTNLFDPREPMLDSRHAGDFLVYRMSLRSGQILTGDGLKANNDFVTAIAEEVTCFSPFVISDCPEDNPISAACNDLINIALLDGCTAVVTTDMALEGDLGCGNDVLDFTVTVVYPDGATTSGYVDRPGRFLYEVTGPDGFHCWGEIQAEDKTPPQFECQPQVIDHVYRTYEVQTALGRLSERQRGQINFSDYSCFQDQYGSPGDCPEPYDVIEFYVSKADVYTFEAWDPERRPDQVENDNELHIALFQGDFNRTEPCANILAQSNIVSEYGVVENEEDPDGRFRLALPLIPGQKYSLLIAQDDCSRDRGDKWVLYAFSDGDGEILDDDKGLPDRFDDPRPLQVKKRLYCSDVDFILNNADYTKNPIATDNCDPSPEIWFQDELTQTGDCGAIFITRTWNVRDAAGREGESCTQRIEFKRPGLRDVQKPPTTVAIECDEIRAEWLDDNGYPKPEIAGYPFVITAFGIVDLNEALCNVGADYFEVSDIEICPAARKIVRQWTILDWCRVEGQGKLNNGTDVNWRQIIKIGDFSAPEATAGEDIIIGAGPFACAGVLVIPSIDVEDNCSDHTVSAKVFKVTEEPEVDKYGVPTGRTIKREILFFTGAPGSVVPNIEVGVEYKLYYRVADACGNAVDLDPVIVTARDEIEPVAVCNDDLTIGIGGEGVARITAADVDEGSWDNCALETLLISRHLATDALRDAWLNQIESLQFSDLIKAGVDDPSGDGAEQWVLRRTGREDVVVLRRKNGVWFTAWRTEQYFICDDMNAPATIELAAFDQAGNVNVCWMEAAVEDKVAPFCSAPAAIVWDCTELPYGFAPDDDAQLDELFGRATSTDNCRGDTAFQVRKTIDWECNSGTIERWFSAKDKNGLSSTNSCYQRIIIRPVHHYEIKFPADATAECGRPAPDTIIVTEIACDLLSVSVVDERFAANEGDACYKIKRTYKVINWCEYGGEGEPVIIGRNEDCDGQVGEDDVYVLRRPNAVYIDRDNDESSNPSTSPCGNGARGHLTNSHLEDRLISNGYWQYSQFLKVYDRTAPKLTVASPDPFCADNAFVRCSGDILIPFSVAEECDVAGLTIQVWLDANNDGALDFEVTTAVLTGAYPNFRITGNYAIGAYAFEIRVADGCQNSAVRRVPFEVVDCKAPTPICINGLAVELMPQEAGTDADGDGDEDSGAMIVWATDFKVSSNQDCSPVFTYSINRVGETPDRDQSHLVLTCDDPDTVMVEIYLWDGANNPYAVQPGGTVGGPNYDHCVTYVVVQDNMFDLCDNPSLTLAGLIATEDEETVEKVEVRLSGPATQTQMTGGNGAYAFSGLAAGADYTVQPWKDNEHLNGVSTFDLVLLTKHLLGIRKLDSPYLRIAADVNRSKTLSTLDLIQLRKMVLSVDTRFRNNSSWRFIPKAYVFPDAEDPWAEPFPELLSFNDLDAEQLRADFIGVKIGDLNGNARVNSLLSVDRSVSGRFRIQVEDQFITAGEAYTVAFSAEQLKQVQGYQFTLEFDREVLTLVDIQYDAARAEHFGWRLVDEGTITTSWNETGQELDGDLFKLSFRAKTDARLRDLLRITSRHTPAEAYDQTDALWAVELDFGAGGDALTDRPVLYQNYPNPFDSETMIRFDLPAAQEATIKIRDLNGRTVRIIRGEYARGSHQIVIDRQVLPVRGVLYYTLETNDFTATRKMIVIGE